MARTTKKQPQEPELLENGADVPAGQKTPKKAVKTQRKGVAKNSKAKPDVSSKTSSNVKKSKRLLKSGAEAHTFTDEEREKGRIRWKQIAAMRREINAQLVIEAKEGGLAKKYRKAIDTEDKELMDLCEKGVKMIGSHFDQSKDALGGENNPMNVKSDVAMKTSPETIKKVHDILEGCC